MPKHTEEFSISHKLLPVRWSDANDDTWEGYEEISVETSICLYDEDQGVYRKAALSKGYVLYPERALHQCGMNPYILFDIIDSEVWGFYADCELQNVFDIVLPERVVVISQVGVNPIYRNRTPDIGLSVVKSWVSNLSVGETLFLMLPDAINRTEGKLASWFHFGKVPSHKRRVDHPEEVLARYWQKAGFKIWPGTPHMYLAGEKVQEAINNL